MVLFRYVALTSSGKKQKGTIEAAHLQEAKDNLRKMGALLLKLAPFEPKFSLNLRKKNLKGNALVAFTAQLSELMRAKVPLYESLLSLEELYRGETYHGIVHFLTEHIKKGGSFSSGLSRFPHSFSSPYVAMVRSGEAVGALDETLIKLAELLAKQNQIKKKLFTSLIYPLVLLVFSLFVITIMLVFVIPSLQALFEDREVNGLTKIVFSLSHFVTMMWPYYLTFLGTTCVILYFYWKKKKKLILDKLLNLPLIKKIMVESTLARFCRTLSTLLKGGVSMKDALTLSRAVIGFSLVESVIREAENKIIEGSTLSAELKKSSVIPSIVVRMVSIGEESGNISPMLEKTASFFEEEVDKKLSRLMALSGPLILLFMGFFIGLIMMAILLPLTDASSFID